MKPLFVRPLSDPERSALHARLRSADAFTLRRAQILLASGRLGSPPPSVAPLRPFGTRCTRSPPTA